MIIKLFTSPSCATCRTLKGYFESNKIPFTEIDVTTNTEERDKLDVLTLPQIQVEGRETIFGFNKTKIDELIKDYGNSIEGKNPGGL
jgi:arsenate reductase-like glutaredoxin family protein